MTIQEMQPGDVAWSWEGAAFPDEHGQWWMLPGSYIQRHPANLTLRWNHMQLMLVERLSDGTYHVQMSEDRHALNSAQVLSPSMTHQALPTSVTAVPRRQWLIASFRFGNAGPKNRNAKLPPAPRQRSME
ncbi:MAG: hypothetical protein ACP5OR_06170 [Candidatus Dormibacteria bacterium]